MLKLSNLESIGKPVYKFHNLHSVDFDGVDDFIQLGEPISYTQHTISTWVKVSNSDASKTIIDARDANDDGIRIFLTSAEVVTYQLNTSDITSGSAISVDEWHHIVGTYDGTTQKLYIDGTLVSSATTSQTISTTTNAEIGARNFSDRANEFLGKIDELAIFDRALTAGEVTAIFRIKYGANLVQNGRFDELGSDLVTNGDFATDSNWTFNSAYWNISGGTANALGVANGSFTQTLPVESGKTYKIEIASTITSGNGIYAIKLGTTQQIFDNNTSNITAYLVASGDNVAVNIQPGASAFSVSSITVKQVDPNNRWTLGTGWSYGDGIASCDGSQTSTSNFVQADTFDNNLTDTYKLSFDLVVTQGSVTASSGSMSQSFTTSGFKSFIGSPATGAGNLNFTAGTTFIGSVTNVMVEKQKYVATNLKLKSTLFNPFTGSTLNLKNYYRFGDGILDTFPYINDMVSPSLSEITSTNLVTHSTDLDSSFSKSNVTLESNAIISPDGTQNASYVKATSSTSTHLISDIMGTNDVIAMSIHAKQGGYSKFRFNSGSSGNGFASFNLADGTIRTTGGTYFYNAEIEDVGDGWYRCKMVLIGSPGTSLTVAIEDDGNQVSFTGEPSKGIYFWGAQGEVQRQVTPLITTTGSTVTRTATVENVYGSMINMTEADITNDVPG